MTLSEPLQYYMHDEPDAFRLELSGTLIGDAARDVYHAWRTALSIIGARQFIVDLTYVATADDYGRALLRLWRGNGVRIVARSDASRALVESTLGETLPAPPARLGLRERIAAFFGRRRTPAAEPPAGARHAAVTSAPPRQIPADFAALFETRRWHDACPAQQRTSPAGAPQALRCYDAGGDERTSSSGASQPPRRDVAGEDERSSPRDAPPSSSQAAPEGGPKEKTHVW